MTTTPRRARRGTTSVFASRTGSLFPFATVPRAGHPVQADLVEGLARIPAAGAEGPRRSVQRMERVVLVAGGLAVLDEDRPLDLVVAEAELGAAPDPAATWPSSDVQAICL